MEGKACSTNEFWFFAYGCPKADPTLWDKAWWLLLLLPMAAKKQRLGRTT